MREHYLSETFRVLRNSEMREFGLCLNRDRVKWRRVMAGSCLSNR